MANRANPKELMQQNKLKNVSRETLTTFFIY